MDSEGDIAPHCFDFRPDKEILVSFRPCHRLAAIAGISLGLLPVSAQAHVKWFCAYNVAGSPQGLQNVLCEDFEQLVLLAISLLIVGCLVEMTPVGSALLKSLDAVTSPIRRHQELVVRLVGAGFFASLWTLQFPALWLLKPVLLTPELTTGHAFVPWLQLAIAIALLSRYTLMAAAGGIVVLFGMSVAEYGVFHLMDYPIFLGLAAYFAYLGLERPIAWLRAPDLLRWSAAITLMWAAIEKWAYPQWSAPLFLTHPQMSMGFDVDFYMRAAGVVEFTLAFALIGSPLMRRIAAAMLLGPFIGAIGEFGKIDAIGHSCIIAVLMVILADDARRTVRRRALVLTPLGYSTALTMFILGYYGLHAALFGAAGG